MAVPVGAAAIKNVDEAEGLAEVDGGTGVVICLPGVWVFPGVCHSHSFFLWCWWLDLASATRESRAVVGAGFVGFALSKTPTGREKVGWLWGAGKPGLARPWQESGKAALRGQNRLALANGSWHWNQAEGWQVQRNRQAGISQTGRK